MENMAYVLYDENYNIVMTKTKPFDNAIEIPFRFLKSKNIIECMKLYLIEKIKNKVNQKYKTYLEKYPEVEIASFKDKAKEAMLIKKGPNIPLEDTPYLSALANNNLKVRNQLAEAVLAKINEAAQLEAYGVQMRDKIKNSQTLEELLNLGI